MDPLDRFREIWFIDSEFTARPGELYDVVCVCGKELRTAREFTSWRPEKGSKPPFSTGSDVLAVAFTQAEAETCRALGWGVSNWLDLRVEHIAQTTVAAKREERRKAPRSLIDVLRFHGISDLNAAEKDELRKLIIAGNRPAIEAARGRILPYCLGDATALIQLFKKLLPGIANFDQALRRGSYIAFVAGVFHRGIPFDGAAMTWLSRKEVRRALRLRLVSDESLTLGLYEGSTLKQARLAEFVLRHSLSWPKTATGRLSISKRTFEKIAEAHPDFAGIAEIERTLKLLHEFKLASGSDGRCRTPIWPFSTITSRAAPNGSAYPFTTAGWTRCLITPPPGLALAYLDFSSMEFGVAAGLSSCDRMLRDYTEGDPYLGNGIEAGLAPKHATKDTHASLRDRLKPLVLAIQYGGGGRLVAYRLRVDHRAGNRLVDLHHRKYAGYWDWSDRKLYAAFADGVLVAATAGGAWSTREPANSRHAIGSFRRTRRLYFAAPG
jgi:hypothetical protein